MAHRLLCLQGHIWAERDHDANAFCPTCGLRLHSESDLSRFVAVAGPVCVPDPTPMCNSDMFRLSRGSVGADPAPAIQPSDIEEIPGYELLGILGRGGMGIVFRARQLSLKRQVALKMILTGKHARNDDRMRFQKEAEAVARLQHPNIVQIYEVGQQNGLPYFSLEFVNAGSLCQFLGGNPQSPEVSARFMLEIARAMHYAHKRGIVHRDLKPANILLHLDEGSILKNGLSADPAVFRELSSYVAKISDFGLAKHVGGEEHLHKHGAIIGTPSYMAPEQAEGGGREVGPAADVYALGAVLYEMLTGRPPFKATSIVETAQQVLMQEPVPPTQLQPKIPRDLETICLTCLQKDPNNRYRSAEALAEDLRRFLANEPILASSTALHHRAFKWARRRPTLAAAVGGIIALAALSFHGWGQMTFELRNERDLAQQELETTSSHLQLALQALDQAVPSGEPSEAKRRAAILRAVTFYQQILREGGEPAPVRPWRAFAYRRLGDLRQQLGERAEADAAYQEAARLFARLVEQHPDRAEFAQQARECLRRDVAKIQASARE